MYFLVVALALYLFVYVVPDLIGVYYSFTDLTKYGSDESFVGLANYKAIFSRGENCLKLIGNTLTFTLFTTLLKTLPAFALLLLNSLPRRDFFRGVVFAPAILSFLVTGLIFKSFLHPDTGFLNQCLRAVGLGALAKGWLISTEWALFSCVCVDTWRGTGYLMTIMIAGLLLKSLARKIDSLSPRFAVVGTASNGISALEMVEKTLPDILVTDIRMPVMELYIRESYAREITLGSLARRFNVNEGYASRIFRKYKNDSPLHYLLTLRVNAAKKLLGSQRKLSIKQVSLSVGYEDQCYFSRLFRNMTGMNLSEYRGSFTKEGAGR